MPAMDKSGVREVHHQATGESSNAGPITLAQYLSIERTVLKPDRFNWALNQGIND